MKKLLSLLSVLTISGTAIPTTIAASPYQKEETINNNNYQQSNNLIKLNRNKRENNFKVENNIYYLNGQDYVNIQELPYPVTTIYTFYDNMYNNSNGRKKGDILFGTTNGVYLRKAGESTTTRINGIDGTIAIIQDYPNNINYYHFLGNVHVITTKGEIYYINGSNLSVRKETDVPYPVTTMETFKWGITNRKIVTSDILFGTTNGVYLRKAGESTTTRINGIDGTIAIIQDYNNNAHVITNKGEIYYINGSNLSVRKETDVPYPVTTMETFKWQSNNFKFGDILFGTTNGVYLRKAGESTTSRINGINNSIISIEYCNINNNFLAYVITIKGEIYYVGGSGNDFSVYKENNVPHPVTTVYHFGTDEYGRKKGDILFGTTNGVYLRKAGESTTTRINGIDGTIMIIRSYSDNYNSLHISSLKILNKNLLERRDNTNNNLDIIPIVQEEDYWCGPAIAEAILRYYGLETLNGSSRQTHYQFQRTLSQQMHTINGGTLINDWITGMNNIILSNRLNYSRTYSRTEFDLAYNDTNTSNRFYNIVSYSLQYNVPVAFMYHGSRRLNEEDHSHFILITGIRNNYSDVIYTFLDPWTGTRGEFNSSNLNSFLTPTRMYDNQERPLSYGGQLASFTGNITNWDYEKTHIHFNENTGGGNSCTYSDISSFTNVTQAVAATGIGMAAGSEVPIIGNVAGGIIGFFAWYYTWLQKCNK